MHPATEDTSRKAEQILINRYRAMSTWRKMRQVVALTQAVQRMALARLGKQYGKMNEKEERLRLAALWLTRETMIRLFGWDPEKQGYLDVAYGSNTDSRSYRKSVE